MTTTKYAFVTGMRVQGYTLRVNAYPETAEFCDFDGAWFTTYRAAQDIANAIKTHAVKLSRKVAQNG
jgi:hypothetical protein